MTIKSKYQDYISHKYWILTITDWDVWQNAMRSCLFKNPIGNQKWKK